jgi:ribonuclease VapC
MPATVLDSFALVAYFRGEAAGVPVKELLQKASKNDKPVHMTEVNYAEAKYMILRKDGADAWAEAAKILIALPIEFHPVDRELADLAADFKSRVSFSLADAFAAALATKHKAELVTGDPEFRVVAKEIKIHWLDRTE